MKRTGIATSEAEAAARFYTGIFENSKINAISNYSEVGFEQHHQPSGTVMVVAFELDGLPHRALRTAGSDAR